MSFAKAQDLIRLARLAASNYCEISELLAHVGLDSRYADTLDFELNAEAAGRIAAAARVSPALVQSLIFPALPPTEAQLTAQVPFQRCPRCLRLGLALLHKSGFERGSPFPGRTYPTATVTGTPSAV